jgi:hypothetical protein
MELNQLTRREFITLLGGIGRSRRARSSRRVPVIGLLSIRSTDDIS